MERKPEALLRLTDVGFTYQREDKSATALHGIDLEVPPGEFLAVIGHNGSGKSTLAKLLNALLIPTSGTVSVAGLDTKIEAHLWSVRQQVGMVFQNPDNQIVATTVEEDVAFGPENLGLPPAEIRERVEEALRLVGMEDYRHRAPHLLSGGQKQRVAIAGVIAMRPRCLVLDEPTSMLDPMGRREVMTTIQRLNRAEGMTVVLVTHFMEEAALADRVLVMEQGRRAILGTPQEVFAQGPRLTELGLDVPETVELAQTLRQAGIPIPSDVLTIDELVDCLCLFV
ncbi:MAG: energy-coupling factor transporter ATPase [Limnochordia bacterium]